MLYKIIIRRMADGAEQTIEESWDEEEEVMEFRWSDGNYACDCNRHLFFERSARHDPGWYEDVQCGEEDYRVIIYRPDGSVLLDELSPSH